MARPTPEQRAAAKAFYEAGQLTDREIGARVGVSHTTVGRWALEHSWQRGQLHTKALKASHERVARTNPAPTSAHHAPAGTRWQLSPARSDVRPNTGEQAPMTVEQAIVDIGAQVFTEIRLRQRNDVVQARNLVSKLFGELERITDNGDLFEMVGEMLFNPDKFGRDRLNELYQAVIQLPQRIKGAKDLADALTNLISLERGVFGLPPIEPPPPPRPKPPPGVLDTPQDTYRWLAGQRGALLEHHDTEDAVPAQGATHG